MPVYPVGTWLSPDTRPDGCETVAAGRFTIVLTGGRFDRHHHDDDELWMITAGKALILVDGGERYVRAGDIVLTPAGSPHDVLEVYEELRGFFVETGHPVGGREGHLHDPVTDAAGHDVPARLLPTDFPRED